MKAWHFLQDNGELRWKCGDVIKPKVGQTLKVSPPVKLCERGLHASQRAIDAIKYAPGALVCRVELSGEIIKDTDKMVATERTILWMANATNTLFEMACWAAERALKRTKVKDERSWNAIHTRRRWLKGEATDRELTAAWDAATDAARDAATDAARAAATDAAWDAARAAAWDAATDAAWDAARDAARAAATDAAWDAARDAEEKAQNRKLTKMLNELKP